MGVCVNKEASRAVLHLEPGTTRKAGGACGYSEEKRCDEHFKMQFSYLCVCVCVYMYMHAFFIFGDLKLVSEELMWEL